jgi:hypothetical protein
VATLFLFYKSRSYRLKKSTQRASESKLTRGLDYMLHDVFWRVESNFESAVNVSVLWYVPEPETSKAAWTLAKAIDKALNKLVFQCLVFQTS